MSSTLLGSHTSVRPSRKSANARSTSTTAQYEPPLLGTNEHTLCASTFLEGWVGRYHRTMSVDIDLAIKKSDDGKWIRERLPARVLDTDVYELANSPMLVRGLAADDRIRLFEDGQYELLERGRNVAVQVFGEWTEMDALAQHVASVGGRLCGKEPRIRVFTLPLSLGLHTIETTIDDVVREFSGLTWLFGNLTPVDLAIGISEGGEPLSESQLMLEHPDGSFELVSSPLLAPGIAAGDRIRVKDDGRFELNEASGNVAVQTFGDWDLTFFTPKVVELGGHLDGQAGNEAAVFTFPPEVSPNDIDALFSAEASASANRTWLVSNAAS